LKDENLYAIRKAQFFGAEKEDKEVNAELFSAKNFALSFLCADEPLEL